MATTLAKSLRSDLISELKLREICSVTPKATVKEAVECMRQRRTGCVLVVDEGKLIGIFTERDYVSRVVARNLDIEAPVHEVMTPSPKTIRITAGVHQVVELMEKDGYRHVPVVNEKGEPVGVLSVKDIVHYLVEYFPANVYNCHLLRISLNLLEKELDNKLRP